MLGVDSPAERLDHSTLKYAVCIVYYPTMADVNSYRFVGGCFKLDLAALTGAFHVACC